MQVIRDWEGARVGAMHCIAFQWPVLTIEIRRTKSFFIPTFSWQGQIFLFSNNDCKKKSSCPCITYQLTSSSESDDRSHLLIVKIHDSFDCLDWHDCRNCSDCLDCLHWPYCPDFPYFPDCPDLHDGPKG